MNELVLPNPILRVLEERQPIPRMVHQIWIGSTPPAWVRTCWALWDEFAAANHLVMNRVTSLDGSISGRVGALRHLPPVVTADLLRLELLARYGGLYMDSDTIPLSNLDAYVGRRSAWVADGQATIADGRPTVSNAMMGFPEGHPLLNAVWEHGYRALRRGVTEPFAIAGPTVLRRLLDEDVDFVRVESAQFPAFRAKQKDLESRLGRMLTQDELRKIYPDAAVVHLSATSWVKSRETLE